MKAAISLLAIAFLLNASYAQPGAPSGEAFSENKRFSAKISAAREDRPILSVFQHDGDSEKHLWSRQLALKQEDEDPDPDLAPPSFFEWGNFLMLVSNSGDFVILRPQHASPDGVAVRILTRQGGDQAFYTDNLLDLLQESPRFDQVEEHEFAENCFELLLESEKPPIYALWQANAESWLVFDLEKLIFRQPAAGELKQLNQSGLAKARELISRNAPGGLKGLLKPVLQTAAEIVPGIAPDDGIFSWEHQMQLVTAYRLLAHLKEPKDKAKIEALLRAEMNTDVTGGWATFGFGSSFAQTVGRQSWERALGDELLAAWENKTSSDETDLEEEPDYGFEKPLHYLGGISGQVKLPFVTPNNTGPVWIYLIPAKIAAGAWHKSDSLIKIRTGPEPSQMPTPALELSRRIDRFRYYFDTLEPGEYRVKAVWDRRVSSAKGGEQKLALPEAGDYESSESPSIKIAAGQRIRNIDLHCTNKVGQADEYFAADELWAKENPPEEATEDPARWRAPKILVKAPLADWVAATNENKRNIKLMSIRLYDGQYGRAQGKSLTIRFSMPRANTDHVMIQARLIDDHGCRFEAATGGSQRIHELSFSTLPFGSKALKLLISTEAHADENGKPYRNGPRETIAASFQLKNLFQGAAEDWQSEPLPITRKLDLVAVELAEVDPQATEYPRRSIEMQFGETFRFNHGYPGGRFQPPESKFNFSSKGWRKIGGSYADRWGNVSASLSVFCREEEVFKYSVQFARDIEKAEFLPDEVWEIPVERIPGAGETIPLNLSKEVQGLKLKVFSIGGTGEFTYDRGQLVSSTNEIDFSSATGRIGLPGGGIRPKLYIKDGDSPHWAGRGMGRRGNTVTIGSRTPHLACRIPQDSATLVGLKEQDFSVPEPMNAPPPHGASIGYYDFRHPYSPFQFLPLDYRAGDSGKNLTLVVQKPRSAEFIIRIPKKLRKEVDQE